MITVQININGGCLMAKSAHRIKDEDELGYATYKTDCGKIIKHKPESGAVSLAKELLNYLKVNGND